MNPYDNPDQYDALVITGAPGDGRTPGIFKWTTPPDPDQGWEKKEAKGSAGGETICNGEKLCECEGEIYLWKDEKYDGFALWDAYKVVFGQTTKDGPNQTALDIYHPVAEEAGVSSFVVRNKLVVVPDGKGGGIIKIKLLQYGPAKKKTGTGKPKGAGAGAKPTPFDPNYALKQKIAAQAAINDALDKPPGGP